jgi:hypothetical protein
MGRNTFKILSEKYSLVQENPLETEIQPGGMHKSDHNVEMTRTKARQAAEVSAQLHEILEKIPAEHPIQAWMVTHVTQSADMLQDVLAKLKEEVDSPEMEPVKDEASYETPEGAGEDIGMSDTMTGQQG